MPRDTFLFSPFERLGLRRALLLLLFALLGTHLESGYTEPNKADAAAGTPEAAESQVDKNRVVKEGIAIEFGIEPAASGPGAGKELVEGREAKIRFSIKDQATGTPLRGLYPAAWLDQKRPDSGDFSCKDKIGSFLQARLAFRPTHDLNAWYILALNEKASISVIDPLVQAGASQMLLDLVHLASPGKAWKLDRHGERLYVTLPDTGKVAVVDTVTWDVSANLRVGPHPAQIALQPDGRYLWVGIDGGFQGQDKPGGVAVIDTETQKVVARIQTGHGHHEIAFSDENHFAYVTNERDGTVSVINIGELKKVGEIKTGSRPTSPAWSASARALYVMDSEQGTIHVIDGKEPKPAARVATQQGAAVLRFTPDGRWGFIANPTSNQVMILDASVNRIVHTFPVRGGPDQILFSEAYAYVRARESAQIHLIELKALNKRGAIPVIEIPAGKNAPRKLGRPSLADAIALTPEKASVVIANSSDQSIYYYMEGMNAPMGSFGNFQRRPQAVLTVDKGLRETSPGVYETDVKLRKPGNYHVAFLLDSPPLTHCFSMAVAVDPRLNARRKKGVSLEVVTEARSVSAGETAEIRVRLTDKSTGAPKTGVEDLRVLAFQAPGIWQKRVWAESVADGEYVANISLPRPGVYYFFFESASLAVRYKEWPRFILRVKREKVTRNNSND